MQFEKYDIEITVILPENSPGYFTSKFRTDEIEVCSNKQNFNRNFKQIFNGKHSNLKKDPLDFLFWKQKEISTSNMTPRQRKSRPCQKCQKRTQRSVFLKILVGDTVNQVGKIAPGLIKNASNKINNEAQKGISQIICQGEKKVEGVLPKILGEPSKMFIKHLSDC